jgi:ribosomal protein S15P/S13E
MSKNLKKDISIEPKDTDGNRKLLKKNDQIRRLML